jgi:large subunit ribosomal protein L15
LPERGFTNAGFRKRFDAINLGEIDRWYEDGEVVNLLSLREKNILKGVSYGLKILGHGELTKKVTIEASAISATAQEKLQQTGIVCTII